MTRSQWKVNEQSTLRAFLAARLSSKYSVRQVKNLLDRNRCQVNGAFERFGSVRLARGDLVELELEEIRSIEPQILYEDEALLVLDKPAGRVSVGKGGCSEWAGAIAVHRLDRDTSGVLLLAKSRQVACALEEQFRKRSVHKTYLAVVVGVPKKRSGRIISQLAIKGRFSGQSVWGSSLKGKEAITEWELVQAGKGESLVRCTLKTGRTHQIRVHLAEMGHPVVGDGQYGSRGRMPGRHLLHAEKLTVVHPVTGKKMTFTAPIPTELACSF